MVRLFFATSIEVYSASAFLFIFSYRAEVTQNISTAESPDRFLQWGVSGDTNHYSSI
jgi:hypothetical protein